jgi:hypothetical protein
MGKPLVSQFQKRFGDRITAVYADKPRTAVEQQEQGETLAKAVTQVIAGILKREPTQEELLGLVDLSESSSRRKT